MADTNPTSHSHSESQRSVADRLRTALHAARGNERIRACLREIVSDPARLDPIVRELGPRHALVRDLFVMARRSEAATERAA
jgi:hypothetical protein